MWAIIYYPFVFSAILIVLALVLFAVSATTSSRLASFIARFIASYFALLICATYGVVASLGLRLVGKHRLAQWTTARAFKWTMYLTTGAIFNIVEGEEYLNSTRPAVIIGNHQSELDVLMLGAIFPRYTSVTAKKSLKKVPVLGWFMALSGTVFLDRARREEAIKAFDGAAKEMKEHKQTVFIFPEGTRSYTDKPILLPFKKGAFHLAVQAGVPIIPVVAENYSRILSLKEKRFTAGEIRVKALKPIPTVGLTAADVDRLTSEIRQKMLNALEEMYTDTESKSLSAPNSDGAAISTGVEVK